MRRQTKVPRSILPPPHPLPVVRRIYSFEFTLLDLVAVGFLFVVVAFAFAVALSRWAIDCPPVTVP